MQKLCSEVQLCEQTDFLHCVQSISSPQPTCMWMLDCRPGVFDYVQLQRPRNNITPRTYARGKAIGYVCHHLFVYLSAQKSPDLDILASEQSVITTKRRKTYRCTCVHFKSHSKTFCWPRPSTTPIAIHVLFPHARAQNWSSIGR